MLLVIFQNPDLISAEPIQAIAPLVAAAIVSGLAAAGSAAVSAISNRSAVKSANATNLQSARETNEANLALAREQNQWNRDQWRLENAWNSPEHQVDMMTDAGMSSAGAVQALNPLSANQLQSAALANQVAPPPVQPVGLDLNGLPSMLGLLREVAALRKENAEADITETESSHKEELILTDLDVKKADLNLKKQNWEQFAESFPYTLRSLRFKASADSRLPALRDLEIKNAQVNYDLASENVKLARQQFGFLEKMNEQQIKKMVEEITNVVKQREVMQSEIGKNAAQIGLANAQKDLAIASTEGQQLENKGKVFDNGEKAISLILKQHGSPDNTAERVGALIASGTLNVNTLKVAFDGMANYVSKGRNALMVNPATRQFLDYFWDKGSANANRHGSSWLTDIDNLFGTSSAY